MRKIKGGMQLPPKFSAVEILRGGFGGFVSILFLGYLSQITGIPWLMAPFGATCVILYAAPASPLAQPRNVILGHLLTASIGLAVLYTLGSSNVTIGLSVGLGIIFMQIFRAVHPPAGANPIVIILAGKNVIGLSFLLNPVLFGSVVLVLIALMINNIGKENSWPKYWHGIKFK